MEQRLQNEHLAGHLSTCLKGLDEALFGGIPFGVLTELVGPAGIGKTQVWFFPGFWFVKSLFYIGKFSLVGVSIENLWLPWSCSLLTNFCWLASSAVFGFQFCLKLSFLAALPSSYGGLDGRVIYIDVESKFSSRRYLNMPLYWMFLYLCNGCMTSLPFHLPVSFSRMIEIGMRSFPDVFHKKDMAQEVLK